MHDIFAQIWDVLSCAVWLFGPLQVPRVEIFMSMIWEQSLDSAAKLQTLREQ